MMVIVSTFFRTRHYVKSFRDLQVYKLSRKLLKDIFEVSKAFPGEEMYSLTDQVRRSSRSVGGQIAESRAKRKYEKHFVSQLTDADGEQLETQHWIETMPDRSYVSEETANDLLYNMLLSVKMLNSAIAKTTSFCN